jgi:hypothetical protein
MPDIDDIDDGDKYDQLLALISGDDTRSGKVVQRKRELNGSVKG